MVWLFMLAVGFLLLLAPVLMFFPQNKKHRSRKEKARKILSGFSKREALKEQESVS